MVLRKLSQTFKISIALLLSVLSTGILQTAPAYAAKPEKPEKVSICHRTKSITNPYSLIKVAASSVDGDTGNDNGQGDHLAEHTGDVFNPATPYPTPHNGDQWGDIIPAIDGVTPGLNWTEGKAIYDNGCKVPTTTPTVLPCVTMTGPEKISKDSQFADSQDTRSAGHYEFTKDGLHIYTDNSSSQAKVAWYHEVDYSLANIGEPAIDYTSTVGIEPGMQIALDKDGNGTVDGILVGEPNFYSNSWWSNADFGVGPGMGYASYGTLDDYLAANPGAVVKAVGFSLGSGVLADGVLKSLTFGCHTWTFEKQIVPVTTCPATLETNHSTNVNNNGWTIPADATYVNGGIKLNVSGNWDTTYIERSFVGPLADIGDQVDFTANPNQYAGIHIVTEDGDVLVYEKEASYGGMWWSTSNFNVASGMGYETFDTLANIVAENPDVMTSAIRVLYTNPQAASSTITSVTVGCVEYTFDLVGGMGGGSQTPETPNTPTNPGQVLGDQTGKTLGTSTVLPATLPATGATSAASPFMILVASLAAYGAAYFAQGRRRLASVVERN